MRILLKVGTLMTTLKDFLLNIKQESCSNPPGEEGQKMKGSVHLRSDVKTPWFYIKFWYDNQQWTVAWHKGIRIRTEFDAFNLLKTMQVEAQNGTFNPLKYTKGQTNVISFLDEWVEECGGDWTPGTLRLYNSYLRNHIRPFFEVKPYQLHEVRSKVIHEFKLFMDKKTKTVKDQDGKEIEIPAIKSEFRKKVVDCLGSALHYAWQCELIDYPPAMPKRKTYQIPERRPKATTEEIQDEIIAAMPKEHQAIIKFMKYHPEVRPASAMMVHVSDYDPNRDVFLIQRGISSGVEVAYTKTKRIHEVPCHSEFKPILNELVRNRTYPFSPFLFTCKESKHIHHRYTKDILSRIVRQACEKVGVKITLYALCKHTSTTKYLKDLHYSPEQVKILTGHASIQSVYQYMDVDLEVKRSLLEGKVTKIRERSVNGSRKHKNK